MSIEVGKYEILGFPPYFFFSLFGGTVSICCYLILLLISKVEVSKKNLFLCIFAIVGVLIGARVFGCLTNIAIALYNNKKMRNEKYSWWINRIKHIGKYCKNIRIDHFRGFEAFYSIKYGAETAHAPAREEV